MSSDPILLEAVKRICDCLVDRTASLFLGAGINAQIKNGRGEEFPLGADLAKWISTDLLDSPDSSLSLDEATDIARFKIGPSTVNKYLYDRFSEFSPGTPHLALMQLPWDSIYTTNFDLLVEQASKSSSITAAGAIKQIFSSNEDVTGLTDADIPYYKLHGSVDVANTATGRLTLTKEDYRFYEKHRRPLFRRLERDLLSRTILFLGYAFKDSNLRAILDDCLDQLGTLALPLSYAVRPQFDEIEATFWREKYNIQLLKIEAAPFLSLLKETWLSRTGTSSGKPNERAYVTADATSRFRRIGESFYQIRPSDCTGLGDPKTFFKGGEPLWADVRDRTAPYRDVYWDVLDAMFPELVDPTLPVGIYLITGAAGTGKTTLIRSLAYSVAQEFDIPVLVHIPSTPFDASVLAPLVNETTPQRLVIIVHHAADSIVELDQFIQDLKRRKLPVTIILEERLNQWASAYAKRSRITPARFELGTLSKKEIESILEALRKHGALGKLTDTDRDYQVSHFTALAHHDLLVALRELTSVNQFPDIVKDEYEKIPSDLGKRAYGYVAAFGQFDLALRYETLIRVLKLKDGGLEEIFATTDRVLISTEEIGSARHNAGFRITARHPVIASIVFAHVAKDDQEKFALINEILSNLDPGFREDRRILDDLLRERALVEVFSSNATRRALYERFEAMLPDDPYVLQHRSRLERDLGDSGEAVRFARAALRLKPGDLVLLNTLGLAFELQAREVKEPLRREALLTEAERIFEEEIRKDRRNPFGYVGLARVSRQRIALEQTIERRQSRSARLLALLNEAQENTDDSPIISHEFAYQQKLIGDPAEALKIVKAGVASNPTEERLRVLWIQMEFDSKDYRSALKTAIEAASIIPNSWRIQRYIARSKRKLNDSVDSIEGHYEAAIRHHANDLGLLVELGSYLFQMERYSPAAVVFDKAKKVAVTMSERQYVREHWCDENGTRITFNGKVRSIAGAGGWILAVPQNFEVFFWRTRGDVANLRVGQPVDFQVRFNAFGAIAHVL